MNPLFGNINQPRQSSPKPKPKTPAEVAAAMLQMQGQTGAQGGKPLITGQSVGAQAGKPFINPQMVTKPYGGGQSQGSGTSAQWSPAPGVAPTPGDSYGDQNQMLQGNYDTTVIDEDGNVAVVNQNGTTATTNVSVKPKPVNPFSAAAGIAAPFGIGYAINQAVDWLTGSGGTTAPAVAAVPETVSASSIPSNYGLGSALDFGVGPLPGAPDLVSATSTSPTLPPFSMSYGPESYLSESMQLPGQIGPAGPVYGAEQIAGAPLLPPGLVGIAAPAAVAALGGYTANQAMQAAESAQNSAKNPITGLEKGIEEAGWLNAVPLLGQAVWGAGALGAAFGSGKDEDQAARDTIRAALKDAGVIDDGYNLTLADGSKYDIGKDGSIQNYNVDFSEENVGDLVASANPLAALITGGDPKLRSDFAGYFTNAAKSSGDPLENIKKIYADAGFNHDSAYGGILKLVEEKKISKEEGDAYLNGLDQLFGVGAYGKGKQEAKESGGGKGRKKEEASKPEAPAPVAPQPPPTVGEPSGTQPVSLQDYVDAIVAVNQANQSEDQAAQMMKLMKMKNPLYGNIL